MAVKRLVSDIPESGMKIMPNMDMTHPWPMMRLSSGPKRMDKKLACQKIICIWNADGTEIDDTQQLILKVSNDMYIYICM